MFAKMMLIILALGAAACGLLVNRQHRIDAMHEMSVVHQRLLEHEQTLWRLRGDIAAKTRPERVREMVEGMNLVWSPIPMDSREPQKFDRGEPQAEGEAVLAKQRRGRS